MKGGEKGTILMIALWILAILMLLTVSLAYRASLEIKLSSLTARRIRAREMAREEIYRLARILKNDQNAYDALNEEWALSRGEEPISYTFQDEERKINLNTFPREVLSALAGVGEEIASAIIDWRDTDDIPLPDGAEDLYYMSLNPPYHCKNKLLESMEELQAIKGVTPELFRTLESIATIYGHGKLNINTASEETLGVLLTGLGSPLSLRDKIILYRQGDNIFDAITTVKQKLQPYGLIPEEEAAIDTMINRNLIEVKSNCYRVSLKAVLEGKYKCEVKAVLSKNESSPIKIVYWKE